MIWVMNKMSIVLGSILIVLLFSNAYALENNSKPIFVFVSVDINQPNSSTISLYQDIQSSIRTTYSDKFYLLPIEEGLRHIKATSIDMLNSVLYIDRAEFINAREKKQPISTLQYIMETYAVEDVLVVDCLSEQSGFVSSCGIYVYNRLKQGFNIAVEKKFTSPISDTSSWGGLLVERLVTNLETLKLDKTQEKLDKLLNESQEEDYIIKAQVSVGINFIKINTNSLYGGTLSLISFLNHRKYDEGDEVNGPSRFQHKEYGFYGGIEGGYYYGSSGDDNNYSWDLDANFIIGNKFNIPVVTLSLEGLFGYSLLKAGRRIDGSNSVGFAQNSVSVGCGLVVQMDISNFTLGIEHRLTKYFNIKHNYSFINKKLNYAESILFTLSWNI